MLECIPAESATRITAELSVPTIGIGAGAGCDGQILVLHDLIGMSTDYVPSFASSVTGCVYAATEADYQKAIAKIPEAFERLEKALEKQGSGPFFNGAEYSLVDAAYAPFLQRYVFLDRIHKIGQLEKYPRLKAWTEAIMNRPSTHSFPAAEFEAMYRVNVKKRNSWVSQFAEPARAAAE